MAWKKGPLPAGTYGWGGVVPVDLKASEGFFFADFCGDTVKAITHPERVLQAHEVAYYDNSLTLPPHPKGKRL